MEELDQLVVGFEDGLDEHVVAPRRVGDVDDVRQRREVLARLAAIGCPCILGNHDEFLFNRPLLDQYTEAPPVVVGVDWCRAELRSDEMEFVEGFVPSLEVDLGGSARLFLFHGTPRSHMENLLATTPPEEVEEMLGGSRATVMAGGHTHIQMVRQHKGALLVNPGSVGQPRDGDPRAAWLELDTEAETGRFHRVSYEIERAAAPIFEAGLPNRLGERLYIGQ